MLPRILCEELCSLNSGVDRLAFSVIWQMDDDAKVYSEWFGMFSFFAYKYSSVDEMMRYSKRSES